MKFFLLLLFLIFTSACFEKDSFQSELVTVKKGDVQKEVVILGRIRSENVSYLRAPFDGQLVKLYKALGSKVEKGEKIIEIQEPRSDERLTSLVEDQGRLKKIEVSKNQAELKITSAKKELNRMERLLKSGSISKAEYESARVEYQLDLKELDRLKAEETAASDSLKIREKTKEISSVTILSPNSGVITQLWTDEERIAEGISIPKDTIAATIEAPGSYVVKSEVIERDYLRLKVGQPATITLIHSDEGQWPGEVKSMAPTPDVDNYGIGKFDVTLSFQNQGQNLKSGLEARAVVSLMQKQGVLVLPRSAIKKVSEQEYLVSYPVGGEVIQAPVQVGLIGDQFIEIIQGLQENQQVYKSYVELSL